MIARWLSSLGTTIEHGNTRPRSIPSARSPRMPSRPYGRGSQKKPCAGAQGLNHYPLGVSLPKVTAGSIGAAAVVGAPLAFSKMWAAIAFAALRSAAGDVLA